MAKDKIIKNGYQKYIMEGVKLYLFCVLFSLISFPGMALQNPIWAILFAIVCYLPAVSLAFITGKSCGVEAYRHTRRIRSSLRLDNETIWTPAQKFFAFHWAKGLIPVAVFAIPQLILLFITIALPNVVTRVLLLLVNMQLVTILNALFVDFGTSSLLLWFMVIPILVIPAVYYAGYIISGFVQRSQYLDIADEVRRFGG